MAEPFPRNLLCFGDNLDFLKDFPGESVDLIYLDPPFNSQQSYNVLFKETTGAPEAAQIKAFEDTWTWDLEANKALTEIQRSPEVPAPLAELTKTFLDFLKPSPMSAYLVQMAVRLVQMHRVLKPTGSLYLHCDPTASHYLKLVLDAIFGPTNFLNEIIWRRSASHNQNKRYGPIHDVIIFYAKNGSTVFNVQYRPYAKGHVESYFKNEDERGKYWTNALTGAGTRKGDSGKPWRGFSPTERGRHWAIPGDLIEYFGIDEDLTPQEKLEALYKKGAIDIPASGNAMPTFRQYLDHSLGMPIQDIWGYQPYTRGLLYNSEEAIDEDVRWIPKQGSKERLGYQTQKPLGLLKRIMASSSNPGDVILDPFCGCGTTIDAVETLNRENPDKPARRWIGIDVASIAMSLIKNRLASRFKPMPEYEVHGEPTTPAGAFALAAQDAHDFQNWALGLIAARPVGGKPKKGADKGIDGVRYFQDEQKGGVMVQKKMIVQIKSGHVKAGDVRDLVGTITREGAELGIFITLEEPTQPMRTEAAAAGTYVSPWDKQSYPKVQILTIEELLKDPHRPNPRCLQVPGGAGGPSVTLPEAPKHKPKRIRQKDIDFGGG
jgi:DNA modification methylase